MQEQVLEPPANVQRIETPIRPPGMPQWMPGMPSGGTGIASSSATALVTAGETSMGAASSSSTYAGTAPAKDPWTAWQMPTDIVHEQVPARAAPEIGIVSTTIPDEVVGQMLVKVEESAKAEKWKSQFEAFRRNVYEVCSERNEQSSRIIRTPTMD